MATVNARSKPSVSARAAASRASPRVWPLAIVLRIARPSAPPISRDVLSRPEATPLCALATPCMATIVDGTSEKPMPSAVRRAPARTLPA